MNDKEKKEKSLNIIIKLLKRVQDDELIISTMVQEGIFDQELNDGMIRVIPQMIGESITMNFLKPAPPQPTIIKSGDTWVSEFMGVDYLFMKTGLELTEFSNEDMKFSLKRNEWKPISEIEITDEIAKLRPMIINASLKRPLILYAVNNVGMFICEKGVEISLLNLATVKDLQE